LRRYGALTGPLHARGFLVTVDGEPCELNFKDFDLFTDEPHPRYLFRLEAALPARGRLGLRDTNYVSSEGTSRLALAAAGLAVTGYDGPPDLAAVPSRPVWQLTDDEERRTKAVEVAFAPAAVASAISPYQHPSSNKGETATRPTRPAHVGAGSGLAGLLDRAAGYSLPLVLLAAFGLGAAHAVQPGHGKTLVAAASLSGRGGPLAAAFLAMVATAAHTGGVAAIAAILWWTGTDRYRQIDHALVTGAGLLVAAVGLWRLGRHLGGHGEHAHADGEGDASPYGSIVSAGLAAGIVPCWDAVLLVVLAAAIGRLGLGLLLLAAFSAGMAGVLVAIGLAAGTLRRRLVERDTARRWERRLGLLSGAVLTAIGLAMLAR
jgi:ABC-type nickel/cobalt efflux system permease component RcnA